MRIGFFGGSFDPPHMGHLRIARAAAERLHLDRVLFAPVAVQPLKREGPAPAGYPDRLAMLRLLLAVDADPRMQVVEYDAPRPDGRPNYTYDTLIGLRSVLGSVDRLFVLLGADSFLSMRHWYRADELLLLADWIVASRPGSSLDQIDQALPPEIHAQAAAEAAGGFLTQRLTGPGGRSTLLHLLPDLREDVSATEIRAALGGHGHASTLEPVLAPEVVSYIREHGLYR
jgi:nicotinate-nucleotide adenylyltransferase